MRVFKIFLLIINLLNLYQIKTTMDQNTKEIILNTFRNNNLYSLQKEYSQYLANIDYPKFLTEEAFNYIKEDIINEMNDILNKLPQNLKENTQLDIDKILKGDVAMWNHEMVVKYEEDNWMHAYKPEDLDNFVYSEDYLDGINDESEYTIMINLTELIEKLQRFKDKYPDAHIRINHGHRSYGFRFEAFIPNYYGESFYYQKAYEDVKNVLNVYNYDQQRIHADIDRKKKELDELQSKIK